MLYDLIRQPLKGEIRNIKCLLSVTVAGVQGTIERMRVSYEFLSGKYGCRFESNERSAQYRSDTSFPYSASFIRKCSHPCKLPADIFGALLFTQSKITCCTVITSYQLLFTYLYSTRNYVVLYYSLHNFTLCTITVTWAHRYAITLWNQVPQTILKSHNL